MPTEKNKFRTAYGEHDHGVIPSGNGMQTEYGYKINAKGQKVLVKTGEINLYDQIQSHHEEVKIENILKRVQVGDYSDFRPNGIFQDVTEVPNNLIEAKIEMNKLETLWKNLPKEVKAKYDWSVETFIAEAGKDSWLIDMGLKEAPKPPKEENKTPIIPMDETK